MWNPHVESHNGFLKEFCDFYNLKNLIKVPTCFENDLLLEKNDDIAETFHEFLTSVVSKLNIPCYQDPFIYSDQTENRLGTKF